eukprot:scaffold69536_cov24-Tisochrysis_lutea.AAC.2
MASLIPFGRPSCGSTSRAKRRTRSALYSSGRARSVVASRDMRFTISALRNVFESSSPMAEPDNDEYRTHRPSTASASRFCAAYAPATGSSTTWKHFVGERAATFVIQSPSCRMAPPAAPYSTHTSSLSFEPTVTTGMAPRATTIWIAARPTPDAAA